MEKDILKKRLSSVPFGNSGFQIKAFIANNSTPERSARDILLQLDKKQKAMEECRFRRRRKEILIKEINEKLLTASGYDRERLEVDLDEAQYYMDEEIKLIEDCVIEIKIYESLIENIPDFSRQEFEKSERLYWEKKLLTELSQDHRLGLPLNKGAVLGLEQMGIIVKHEKGQLAFYGNIENRKELGLFEINNKPSSDLELETDI